MNTVRKPTAFIATLGTEPQVVTIVIDRLHEERSLTFDEAVIIHTLPRPFIAGDRPDPMQASLDAVQAEMTRYLQAGVVRSVPRYVALRLPNGAPLYDIHTEHDAAAVFRAIDAEVRRQRDAGRATHLSAAGGRKGMTMYAMAAAQFRFRPGVDRLWLLASTPEFQRSRALHTTHRDDAFIIPIPVIAPPESFEAELIRRGVFVRALKPQQREVLQYIARDGLNNRDIAQRLRLSSGRIEQLVGEIRASVKNNLKQAIDDHHVREALVREFGPYFQWRDIIDPSGSRDDGEPTPNV